MLYVLGTENNVDPGSERTAVQMGYQGNATSELCGQGTRGDFSPMYLWHVHPETIIQAEPISCQL
jgi:hypothetical protein